MSESKPISNNYSLIRRIISLCLQYSWAIPAAFFRMFCRNSALENGKKSLQDKVVVITGASSGIGEAIAHSFYAQGCCVVLLARRIDELNRVKNDLLKTHSTVRTHPPVVMQIDLSDLNSLSDHVTNIIKICGRIDILINNAGISYRGFVASTSIDVDIKVMLINYFSVVALTKAVIQHMIERKSGHLVYMSSLQGLLPMPYRSAYSASKHALESFCNSLRAEVDKHNINVTVIAPTYANTSLSSNAITGTGEKYGLADDKQKSGLSPEEVAIATLNAVATKQYHVFVAPLVHKLAVFLTYFPNLLHRFMMFYAKKNLPQNATDVNSSSSKKQ